MAAEPRGADTVLAAPDMALRIPDGADAEWMAKLAGAREVAYNTTNIPHPYTASDAEWFIAHCREGATNGRWWNFAICPDGEPEPVGMCGLGVDKAANAAELGYWVGVPYWGRGYASSAARAVVAFGFESLALNRIFARWFLRNPASNRIQQKLGMQPEGVLRESVRKWGEYLDVGVNSLLRREWK